VRLGMYLKYQDAAVCRKLRKRKTQNNTIVEMLKEKKLLFVILLADQYSGEGYRARALLYSLECFFDALDLSDLMGTRFRQPLPFRMRFFAAANRRILQIAEYGLIGGMAILAKGKIDLWSLTRLSSASTRDQRGLRAHLACHRQTGRALSRDAPGPWLAAPSAHAAWR